MNKRKLFFYLVIFVLSSFVFSGTIKISALVDGSDYIKIKGNNIWVEHRNFDPIKDLKYKFDPPEGLPDRTVNVKLKKEKGTGSVTIVDKPSRDNNYTLTILVDNDNEEVYPQLYKFTVYWKEVSSIYSGFDKDKYDYVHWRGSVDGRDILIFNGRSVEIKRERGKEVENVRYSFSSRIPRKRINVYLKKVDGRGKVEVIENPSYENNYSIKVLVDDGPYSGRDVYDFYVYWEKDRYSNEDYDFVWEGKVDGADYIIVRGSRVFVKHLRAKPIRDMHYKFYSYLPEKPQDVELIVLRGRGKVKIVEQPSFLNRYGVKILIDDSKGGDYRYKIALRWEGGKSISKYKTPSVVKKKSVNGGVIRWRGYVDGVVELRFRRNSVISGVIRGRKLKNVKTSFFKSLPRKKVKVSLNKISGRGRVEILQQPTKYNDYSVVVRIIDDKKGMGLYEFELYW